MQGDKNGDIDDALTSAFNAFAESRSAIADTVALIHDQNEKAEKKAAKRARGAVVGGVLLIVAIALGVWVLYHQHGQPTSTGKQLIAMGDQNRRLGTQNGELLARLNAVTDPHGCTTERGQAQTALLVWGLEADNHKLHHAPIAPPDPAVLAAAMQVCAGDPGGPPLTTSVPTTTTTSALHTPTTAKHGTSSAGTTNGSGSGSITSSRSTTTTAPACIAGMPAPCVTEP